MVWNRYLGLARLLIILIIMTHYMAGDDIALTARGIFAVSAAFFVCSTAAILEWLPVNRNTQRLVLRAEVLVAIGLGAYTSLTSDGSIMQVLFLPLIITSGVLSDPSGYLALAGWLSTMVLTHRNAPLGELLMNTAGNGSLMLFGWGAGLLIRAQSDARERAEGLLRQVERSEAQLRRAHGQLVESARRQMELATLEERQRMARDMHDGVAHRLTALVVQLQAGCKLLDRDPDKARTVLNECVDTAREALLETRLAVRALRNPALEGQTLLGALERLGSEFGRAVGLTVEVTGDDGVATIAAAPEAVEALYRVVQEAMTNAYKHGRATRVTVSLSLEGEGRNLRLGVGNNGLTPDDLSPGIGLYSMRERVESMGGSFSHRLFQPGFGVEALIPVESLGGATRNG